MRVNACRCAVCNSFGTIDTLGRLQLRVMQLCASPPDGCTGEIVHCRGFWVHLLSIADPHLACQVRAAQHLLSEKGSILDIPREMSACMADGRYMELVKLYRKAHTTYSSSILSKVCRCRLYLHGLFCVAGFWNPMVSRIPFAAVARSRI